MNAGRREHGHAARTERRRRPFVSRSGLAALLVVALTPLLAGCVYLRLLELKRQLGKFDEFFALQTQDGLAIVCHEPVLRADDLRWIGLHPESVRKLGRAEHWRVRWVKQLPVGATESAEHDIALDLGLVEGRLNRVHIPERYFALMPKSFVIGVLRSVAGGNVDKARRQLDATVAGAEVAAARPRLPSIDKLLGRPSEERIEGTNTVVRYRYVPSTPEPKAGVFDMTLHFDTKTGELLRWHGQTPVGNLRFSFSGERRKEP